PASESTSCRPSATVNQAPGTALSSERPTTLLQNQPVGRSNSCIRSNQLTKMPANSGIMIAHRNGLPLAQAEHSSSQPTVGSAHSAYTGSTARVCPAMASGLAGPSAMVNGLPPWTSTNRLITSRNPSMVRSAAPIAISGATTVAVATFDSTVCASDSGSDFQNST